MPMLAFVSHLTLVNANGIPARVAVLGKHGIEAVQAEGPAVTHDVPLSSQLSITLEAGEVFHVPRTALSLRTFVRQDNLIAGGATWFEGLGVVSAAVQVSILPEVNEIDQQLSTHVAVEAGRVPTRVRACTRRYHHDVPTAHTLATVGTGHGGVQVDWQLFDGAAAQGLPFALGREETELLLLLVAETVAVADLIVVWGQLVQELAYPVLLAH